MDDLGEHISFLMDSDIEPDVGLDEDNEDDEEDEGDHEEEELEDHFDSDFDAIDFGIQERIRQARQLDDDLEEEEEEDLEEENDEEDDGELSEDEDPMILQGNHYDGDAYRHLAVGSDVSTLFKFIDAYKPIDIDIETQLKPFTYDYIPAVGDIDAFIKVPRPDGQLETLGRGSLDEPAAKQSDPSVLDLQLRALSRFTQISSSKGVTIKKVDCSKEAKTKAIEGWIRDISDLHRCKPPLTVVYGKPMPEIDSLMQEWPPAVENLLLDLGNMGLNADLDIKEEDISDYVDLVCNLCDIPIYKSRRIESLYVLFSLYSSFKQLPEFWKKPSSVTYL